MALTNEQRKILAAIQAEAKRRGAPYKHVKAAVETGLVESGLRNLPGGDADSQGWRQERASLYKNPTNVQASVKRFFDEAAQHDRGGIGSGELAARVQRPAAQYRGRYNEVAGKAAQLLKELGSPSVAGPSSTPMGRGADTDVPSTLPDRKGLLQQYLTTRNDPAALLALGQSLKQQTPSERIRTREAKPVTPQGVSSFSGIGDSSGTGKLLEMFHDPGISLDNGRRVGAIGGHGGHVHAAFSTPAAVKQAASLAQQMGLSVRENPAYDKVDPVHTKGSFHYQTFKGTNVGKAIDVSGDPKKLLAFNRLVAKRFK